MSTDAQRYAAWSLRDGARQRALEEVPRVGEGPRVLATPRLRDDSVGCVVWNPRGTGRLRLACPVPARVHPPLRPGGLEFSDTYLVLDDVPLLHWRENGCPSCEQLARAAAARPSDVRSATSDLHAWTRDAFSNDPAASAPLLAWLLSLLPAGFYLVALREYAPIVARRSDATRCLAPLRESGSSVPFDALTRFDERAYLEAVPHRLLPTQRLGAPRPESVARARASHRTHPGIALHLHNATAALLDGHHRALAAAEEDVAFSCFTVIPGAAALPPLEPGARRSARAEGAPEVVFRDVDLALSSRALPEELHAWTRALALAACTSRRWERDATVVTRWEANFEELRK